MVVRHFEDDKAQEAKELPSEIEVPFPFEARQNGKARSFKSTNQSEKKNFAYELGKAICIHNFSYLIALNPFIACKGVASFLPCCIIWATAIQPATTTTESGKVFSSNICYCCTKDLLILWIANINKN